MMAKKKVSSRLPYKLNAIFSGDQINRTRPISFKFEGQVIQGFEGDTILSALLANDINTVGTHNGSKIGLTPEFCPPVIVKSKNAQQIVPMDRTPALNGLNLTLYRNMEPSSGQNSSATKNLLSSIWNGHRANMEFDIDSEFLLPGPWIEYPVAETRSYDLVVVGGGIAGLSAAKLGLEKNLKVALVEQRGFWGGDAEFFGAVEGEARPEEIVFDLVDALEGHEEVDMILHAQALSMQEGRIVVHQVGVKNGEIFSSVVELQADRIVLACGMNEKLPLFSGNRLPGVIGSRSAFFLASKFGVWGGKSAALATASSIASRVTLLASDLDVNFVKLADSRSNPKSRFFEFAKAYGFSLATGTIVSSLVPHKSAGLWAQFGLSGDFLQKTDTPIQTDKLIVCGGWQPNLHLWQSIGGKLVWNTDHNQLVGLGRVNNVSLAGSCNGAMNMTDCKLSGENAVRFLYDAQSALSPTVQAKVIFESSDGPLPVSKTASETTNCYLDRGYSLARPKWEPKLGFWKRFTSKKQVEINSSLQTIRGNTLGDVAAKTMLGEISSEFAGIFAQERSGHFDAIKKAEPKNIHDNLMGTTQTDLPRYLVGRFGSTEKIANASIPDRSMVEAGCLIFPNQNDFSPAHAIGCMIGFSNNHSSQIQVYLTKEFCGEGSILTLRNGTQSIQITIAKNL